MSDRGTEMVLVISQGVCKHLLSTGCKVLKIHLKLSGHLLGMYSARRLGSMATPGLRTDPDLVPRFSLVLEADWVMVRMLLPLLPGDGKFVTLPFLLGEGVVWMEASLLTMSVSC